MPCSRCGHSYPALAPPQLRMKRPAESNSSTGGAAFCRCASGTVAGLCRIHTWSCASTATEDTSPKTQLLGIVGHDGCGANIAAAALFGPGAATAIDTAITTTAMPIGKM